MVYNSITLGIGFLVILLVLWSIADIFRLTMKEKVHVNILWILMIFMLPIIGSILYWQLGRPSAKNHKRVFRPDFNRTQR